MSHAVMIFFNAARDDYLVRGPFKNYDSAMRAKERCLKTFRSAKIIEIIQMGKSENDERDDK